MTWNPPLTRGLSPSICLPLPAPACLQNAGSTRLTFAEFVSFEELLENVDELVEKLQDEVKTNREVGWGEVGLMV